ncbi:thiamine phosphate synthase [Botryobacter ruber]|uniref:thiamine phosphate synthase n=1 Tax=Botryobacter ruber TaxID=2171629 RepID=UPI000E0A9535|nr:thiamine phosphate synthase [Botryobacter ruber]
MHLIVITTPHAFPNEHQLIHQLLEAGLETLHVRKPGYSLAEMRAWLSQISVLHHPRLMLHQHHELAQEFRVKGLHFPEAVRATAATTPKMNLLFSTSFHALQELPKPHPLFDYAFLSPVFDSISKEGYAAAFAEEDVKKALQTATVPVVALGGVAMENLAKVRELGFAGAAVLGAVWQADEPVKVFSKLSELGFVRLKD